MRKILSLLIPAALLLTSCSYKENLFVALPGTAWSITKDGTTTWACFHDEEHASLLQLSSDLNRYQIDHGTYETDGHVVTVSTEYASSFQVNRTFWTLKRPNTNDSYTRLEPFVFPTLAGTVWASAVSNDLHIAYFPSDGECLELVYKNITREETVPEYGWSGEKKDLDGKNVTFYRNYMTMGVYAAGLISEPVQEEGASSLKGTVWTYNNIGYPADVPSVILFTGKEQYIRLTGVWSGSVSSVRVNPIVFDVTSGTYTESDGNLTLTIGENKESCPISGGSFTLYEKTYKKLDY